MRTSKDVATALMKVACAFAQFGIEDEARMAGNECGWADELSVYAQMAEAFADAHVLTGWEDEDYWYEALGSFWDAYKHEYLLFPESYQAQSA